MSKKVLFAVVAVFFFLSSLASVAMADKEQHPSWGKPFQLILNTIKRIERRISALETDWRIIWKTLRQQDERITALEKKPTSVFKVYDADGQFLGVLDSLNYQNSVYNIYNPLLDRFLPITLDDGGLLGMTLYFESRNCTGSIYSSPTAAYSYFEHTGKYYAGEKIVPVQIQVKSQWASTEQLCREVTWGPLYMYVIPVQEVEPPVDLPVALPLSSVFEPLQ